MQQETFDFDLLQLASITSGTTKKGDVLGIARIAGIMGNLAPEKRTA